MFMLNFFMKSVMSSSGSEHGNEGMDLDLHSDAPSTPSEMDSMFDPMFKSLEGELKPMHVRMPTTFDMNMQGEEDFENRLFDSIPVKPELLPLGESPENWEVSGGIAENGFSFSLGSNGSPRFTRGGESFGPYQFQLNGVENEVEAGRTVSYGVDDGEGMYPYYPRHQTYRNVSVGTRNRAPRPQNVTERRQKRMIKNRESAARSRARRLAFNAQQKLEIQRLKDENEFLNRVLRTLMHVVQMNIEEELQMKGIQRTFSAPLPLESEL